MTAKQKIELERIKTGSELNTILDIALEDRSDDQKNAVVSLSETMRALDADLTAAILAAPEKPEVTTDVKPEDRELRELIGKASIDEIVSGALRNKPAAGASKELQDHLGLASNEVPLELLRVPVEERAVTTAPSDVGAQQESRPVRS